MSIKESIFAFGTLLAVLVAGAYHFYPSGPVKTVYEQRKEQMFDPSVQLLNYTKESVCSGTVIKSKKNDQGVTENYVLTAKHCVSGLSDYYRVKYNGEEYTSFPVYVPELKQQDVAVFMVASTKTFPTAKLASKKDNEDLFFSQEVYSVSYPGGSSKTFTIGNYQGIERSQIPTETEGPNEEPMEDFYKVAVNNMPGSSGSALFVQNAQNEYVIVGVLTAGVSYLSYYTPWDDVNRAIESAGI